MTDQNIPFEAWFKRRANDKSICFLCGKEIDENTSTREHIIPRWVTDDFYLSDEKITLLNDTTLLFQNAIIPCCKGCNSNHLSKLEKRIREGVVRGYEYFKSMISPIHIYQWCQLIFYKFLYKATFLKNDRKLPNSKYIISEEEFQQLKTNHLFLRSIDKDIVFKNFSPGSVFICNTKAPIEDATTFDYFDRLSEQCFSIRMNDIGIVVALADSGMQEYLFGNLYKNILEHQLSPSQFKNFFIEVVYRQQLFTYPFQFDVQNITESSLKVVLEAKDSLSEQIIYRKWNDNDYRELLARLFDTNSNALITEDGKTRSLFYDDNGSWVDRSFEDEGFNKG